MSMIKTAEELEIMREGGKKLADIRDRLLEELKPGALPIQIDTLAKELIAKAGGSPSFMTVNNYQWATCINVNDVVVHGIPTSLPLREGDIVGLDVGLLYKEFHTDTSWTKVVGTLPKDISQKVDAFLKVGELALHKAIAQATPGHRIGHISRAMQETVEKPGYFIVRSLVGHGVGRELHEAPQVPGALTRKIEKTPKLLPGMVLAVEVIYNEGSKEIVSREDGWTLATADGSLSGLFELTIAVTEKEPLVLT